MASLTQWIWFEQTPGDSEGQGSLACCSPWGHKELDMMEQMNSNKFNINSPYKFYSNSKESSVK